MFDGPTIVGIAVAGVAFIAVVVVVALMISRRRRRNRMADSGVRRVHTPSMLYVPDHRPPVAVTEQSSESVDASLDESLISDPPHSPPPPAHKEKGLQWFQ